MNDNNFKKYINSFMPYIYSKNYINAILEYINNLCNKEDYNKYELKKELKLTRIQIASLLANMFLNKIDSEEDNNNEYLVKDFKYIHNELKTNSKIKFSNIEEYYLSLEINDIDPDEINILSYEKIKFIMNYFINIYEKKDNLEFLNDIVTFKFFKGIPNKDKNIKTCDNVVLSNTLMDDISNPDVFIMNFANKYVGGKVLTKGCCQEEIKFLTNPELIILKLLVKNNLEDDEIITIENTIKYSNYTGYGFDLMFNKNNNNLNIENFVEIDALQFNRTGKYLNIQDQYKKCNIDREINKLLVGFGAVTTDTIITGNWGGGAFNGDPILKFLIQWYSSILSNKKLIYCTNNSNLYMSIKKIIDESNTNIDVIINKIYNYS